MTAVCLGLEAALVIHETGCATHGSSALEEVGKTDFKARRIGIKFIGHPPEDRGNRMCGNLASILIENFDKAPGAPRKVLPLGSFRRT